MRVCTNQSEELEKNIRETAHDLIDVTPSVSFCPRRRVHLSVYEDPRLNYTCVCGVFFLSFSVFVDFVFVDRVSGNGILWKREAEINGSSAVRLQPLVLPRLFTLASLVYHMV